MKSRTAWLMLGVATTCLALAVSMSAQIQTETTTTHGTPTKTVQVNQATVVAVEGNDLVVKMQDGTIKHIPNVPESARATTSDGQQVGIHDLKPGMVLTKTITTTTTPKIITTTKSVTGKVWYVNPPLAVILTLEDGQNHEFKIPKGQKFNVNGQMVDAWGLKKGMTVSATQVVEVPETVVSQSSQLASSNPPPPPPPDQPILVAVVTPAPAPAAASAPAAAPAAELPKTGSELPLIGLLGLLSLGSSFGLRALRSK